MKSPIYVLKISGNSMKPFAKDGDYAISTRVFRSPKRGEVLIFRSPEDGRLLMKRVRRIDEAGGENRYFLEGDNRMRSTDSKAFGSVGREAVVAKVLFVASRNGA